MSVQLLQESMDRMDESYSKLIEIMQDKKQAVISNDYTELVRTLSQESKLIKNIEELEKDLLASAQGFLKSKGVKSQLELTITEILRLVFDPEEKRLLTQSRAKIEGRLQDLKRLNSLNQDLIGQSLTFIDYSLNLMMGGMDDEATYSPPQSQDKKPTVRSNMFDTRG